MLGVMWVPLQAGANIFAVSPYLSAVTPLCPLLPTTRVLLADAAGSITGVEAPVEGTPHDFRSGASLGGAIAGIEAMQPRWPHGDAYLTSNQSKVADYESLAVQDAASELNQWSKSSAILSVYSRITPQLLPPGLFHRLLIFPHPPPS